MSNTKRIRPDRPDIRDIAYDNAIERFNNPLSQFSLSFAEWYDMSYTNLAHMNDRRYQEALDHWRTRGQTDLPSTSHDQESTDAKVLAFVSGSERGWKPSNSKK